MASIIVWDHLSGNARWAPSPAPQASANLVVQGVGKSTLLHSINFNTLRQGSTWEVFSVMGTTSASIAHHDDPYTMASESFQLPFDIQADAFIVSLLSPYISSEIDVTVLFK